MGYVILLFIAIIVLSLIFGKTSNNLPQDEKRNLPKDKPILAISVQRTGNTGALENTIISLYENRILIGALEIIYLENIKSTDVRTVVRYRQRRIYGAPMGAIEMTSYYLEIKFLNKGGYDKSLTFWTTSKWTKGVMEAFSNEVNKRIGYTSPPEPSEPYEL